MKSIITTITTLLVIVITFASAEFVNANDSTTDTLKVTEPVSQETKFEKMEKSLLYGLSSEVGGVLEATLFNAVAFKTLNPEFNSDSVNEQVRRHAANGVTHLVRYKATLTLSYLKDQESFDVTKNIETMIRENNANGTFQLLVDSIQERQVAETRN